MADFVLLYRGGGDAWRPRRAARRPWTPGRPWFGTLGDAVKDGGNPFAETAKRVASDGSIDDVPTSGIATGYSILRADSLDAATTLAKDCPVLQGGGEIEVYETFPVSEPERRREGLGLVPG